MGVAALAARGLGLATWLLEGRHSPVVVLDEASGSAAVPASTGGVAKGYVDVIWPLAVDLANVEVDRGPTVPTATMAISPFSA